MEINMNENEEIFEKAEMSLEEAIRNLEEAKKEFFFAIYWYNYAIEHLN